MHSATRTQLIDQLRSLGLASADLVMLHASVRAIGPVIGEPDEIHLAALDAVSPGGTVMMYVGCQDGVDDLGRGKYATDVEAAILDSQPPFDPQTARAAREFGVLAEFFRSTPGTICSENAARFAARGGRARWLVADQPWNYAFGRGSPLDKLCAAGGKLLLLGSRHDEVTLLHYAEHIGDFAGKRIARYQVPLLKDGRRVWVPCEEFDTSGSGVHANWPPNFFELIVDDFVARFADTGDCRRGRVGNTPSVLIDAARLIDHALPIMTARAAEGAPRGATL